jgi:hypothetical protein
VYGLYGKEWLLYYAIAVLSEDTYVILALSVSICVVRLVNNVLYLGATMALYEERGEHGEHDEQVPRKWYSRFARERINLSASVEAALIEKTSQDPDWQDDSESEDELDGKSSQQAQVRHDQPDTVPSTSYSKALIPPRISLQSRVLPALYPGGFVEEATASARSQSVTSKSDVQREQQPSTAPQNTGILTRLAQRLTSSLAAFGGAMHPEMVVQLETTDQHETQDTSRPEHSTQFFTQVDASEVPTLPGIANEHRSVPLVRVIQPGEQKSSDLAHAAERKQRLGRTTRVRLQTASQMQGQAAEQVRRQAAHPIEHPIEEHPIHTHMQDEPNTSPISPLSDLDLMPEHEAMAQLRSLAARTREDKEGVTSAHLPAVDVDRNNIDHVQQVKISPYPPVDQKNKEVSSPPVIAYDEGHDTAANPKMSIDHAFGNGAFESGQQEATILDQHVTEGCIVQIMLLNDPGPVVVHYISLQPHIGFTVHLTAPAVMHTAFNYIIFRDGRP